MNLNNKLNIYVSSCRWMQYQNHQSSYAKYFFFFFCIRHCSNCQNLVSTIYRKYWQFLFNFFFFFLIYAVVPDLLHCSHPEEHMPINNISSKAKYLYVSGISIMHNYENISFAKHLHLALASCFLLMKLTLLSTHNHCKGIQRHPGNAEKH